MQKKRKIAFRLAAGTLILCTALLTVQQCYSYSDTIGGKYAETEFQAAMANDPSGDNTLEAKLPFWQNEKWSGNEVLYESVRQGVDTSRVSYQVLELTYQVQAEREPHSAIAQFRWAYALWRSIASKQPSSKRTSTLSALFYALAKANSPDTYNYARLRYLMSPSYRYTCGFGERLLRRDPKDDEVKSRLVGDYASDVGYIGNPDSKLRALALCHQLLQDDPKRARYYAVLGTVYEASYIHAHNAPDALAAIVADRKYISLVDPQSEYAQMERGTIAEIQTDLAKDKQSMFPPR